VGSVDAAVVSVDAAVGSAVASSQAAVVVAVAPVVSQQHLVAASPIAIVRPVRIKVRHVCKKKTRKCSSSDEQESGSGRVREHLMSERVLFGQVNSTPDQLVPQKSNSQLQSGKRRTFEQTRTSTHATVHLHRRVWPFLSVVVPLLLQKSLIFGRHCIGTGQGCYCCLNGILEAYLHEHGRFSRLVNLVRKLQEFPCLWLRLLQCANSPPNTHTNDHMV